MSVTDDVSVGGRRTVDPRRVVRKGLTNQPVVLALLTLALFVGFGVVNPQFFNVQFVVFPLLREASVFVVVGLAQMCVLSVGQMNLAVGRMAAVGAMAAGACYQYLDLPLYVGAAVGLSVGAMLGLLAGWIIVKSHVNAFVVTLALDFALLGLVTLVYMAVTDSGAFSVTPDGLELLGNGSFADVCAAGYCGVNAIPILAVPALITVLLIHHLYVRSRIGREILATGASHRTSELSGIPANSRVILAHVLSGTLAALAGIMLAATSGSFSAAIGSEFMIPSFLAPVLGGTLLVGGVVSVMGTVIGTLMTLVIRWGLSVAGLGFETLNIALGSVLLVALSVQRFQSIKRKKKETAS